MPTYEYHCSQCGKKSEFIQKITADPLKECPYCHQETLKRGPGGGIGLQFKGNGFYINDYANPGSCGNKSPEEKACCPCSKSTE